MMKETEEMRAARHELQILSGTDPAAASNMSRHVAALAILLTGRRQLERKGGEPAINAGFRLVHGEQHLVAAVTRQTGIEQVYMAFDIDDAAGPPLGIGVFRNEGGDAVIYGACRLWSPVGDGRAVLVPCSSGELGHFSFRAGGPLRHGLGSPAADLEAGFRRAVTRLTRLANSGSCGTLHREAYMHVVGNDGPLIHARTFKIAA